MSTERMMKVAIKAAKEAGRVLMENLGRVKRISYKSDKNLVTEIDHLSERVILKIIKSNYPDHDLLSEEGGKGKEGSRYRWLIDPLDGTTNYAHGYPCFSVSIALEKDGETILGIVYDPLSNELFKAEKGKGAFLNGERILVSPTRRLEKSLLATGFPYDLRYNPNNNMIHFENFALRTHALRRDGSAALDLSYVAMGRLDGFWELRLNPWDFAAGSLIVAEAGGITSDLRGRPLKIETRDVVASNGRIHKQMLKILALGLGSP